MKTDVVILWVNGNDPKWLEELAKYSSNRLSNKNNVRFRDWDNLQYLFRAFERFVPWVRKIHFVTWGHIPDWLNAEHPRINIVRHEEYIDNTYLPVFNANPLEINLHHIQDLAEEFIFFNDDFFIVSPLEKERFFKDGLPCDAFVSNAISSSEGVGHFVLNNLEILNRHFHKRDTFKSHFRKVFNLKYGFDGFVRNVALSLWPRFTGFVDPHMPQPFLKSTFEEVWEREKKILDQTSASKFRNCDDTNQYLFRYWQLAKGAFSPVSMKDTKYLTLSMQNLKSGEVTEAITSEKYAMICLNDNEAIGSQEDFEEAKRIIGDAFEKLLPEKSSFEL